MKQPTPRVDAFAADDSQFTGRVGDRERALFKLARELEIELAITNARLEARDIALMACGRQVLELEVELDIEKKLHQSASRQITAITENPSRACSSEVGETRCVEPMPESERPVLTGGNAGIRTSQARDGDSGALIERVAQLTAHRACLGVEHDAMNGRLHGYCVVCGIPWPCPKCCHRIATAAWAFVHSQGSSEGKS
jgi:hypothetical protein